MRTEARTPRTIPTMLPGFIPVEEAPNSDGVGFTTVPVVLGRLLEGVVEVLAASSPV